MAEPRLTEVPKPEDVPKLRIRRIPPADLPMELAAQKHWDLDVFYRQAVTPYALESWLFWLVFEEDQAESLPRGAIGFVPNQLHRLLQIDTIIVDKAFRTRPMVDAVLRLTRELSIAAAKAGGWKRVGYSAKAGEFGERNSAAVYQAGRFEPKPVETFYLIELPGGE